MEVKGSISIGDGAVVVFRPAPLVGMSEVLGPPSLRWEAQFFKRGVPVRVVESNARTTLCQFAVVTDLRASKPKRARSLLSAASASTSRISDSCEEIAVGVVKDRVLGSLVVHCDDHFRLIMASLKGSTNSGVRGSMRMPTLGSSI